MATRRIKQSSTSSGEKRFETKKFDDLINNHRHLRKKKLCLDDDNTLDGISTRRSNYPRSSSRLMPPRRKRKVSSESLSTDSDTTDMLPFPRTIKSHLDEKKDLSSDSYGTICAKEFNDAKGTESPIGTLLDPARREDTVRKLSMCVSFYGNFVLIPNLKAKLQNIANIMQSVELEYWPDVMAFVDSYDLPYTSAASRKLIDGLVNEMTHFVEAEGMVSGGWQKILCTLPDDTTIRLDYRLGKEVIKEVEALAIANQLPFHLSEPMRQLLVSLKTKAAEYLQPDKD